jgi:hypothetical protein
LEDAGSGGKERGAEEVENVTEVENMTGVEDTTGVEDVKKDVRKED